MSDRCKLGDIAIIIKDIPGCEVNIGRVVHVRGPRQVFPMRGTVWHIKPVNGTRITYLDIDRKVRRGVATDIEHEDNWLLPIRPEADDGQIEQSNAEPINKELESV